MKAIACPICNCKTEKVREMYRGMEIFTRACLNKECGHTWLPHEEEMRFDKAYAERAKEGKK